MSEAKGRTNGLAIPKRVLKTGHSLKFGYVATFRVSK
jgi:hypothetical protein